MVSGSLRGLFACIMICCTLAVDAGQALTKKRVLADLDCIHSIFEVKYAPKQWKEEFASWDLTQAIDEAKGKVENHPAPTLKECQVILRDFFNSTKDYHVGVRFYSTEGASLPFLVKSAEGRYFVSYVDRDQLSKKEFPFEEGDEILSFDGRAIGDVVQELRLREYGNNTPETDQALAEMTLTHRRGDMGHEIPSGKITIRGIKKNTNAAISSTLTWGYVPEKIRDFSKLDIRQEALAFCDFALAAHQDLEGLLKKTHFFDKCMLAAHWDKSYVGGFTELNKHSLGARTSFIPALGKKIWKSTSDSIFDAYIFEMHNGKKIGYIRLPHYIGDEEEVEEFGQTMNLFQKKTDALVIDQINNPGGSVFYLYALASTLTNQPLYAPKHRIAMTQEEVFIAQLILQHLEPVTNDETARMVIGETMGGYPVDYRFAKVLREFCHFLIGQWENSNLFSDPTFLFGVDEIQPHPRFRYTKPILLLINSLDFSGGDFFPAILQDNKRAKILGTRTAGAGGYIISNDYPNHSGIRSFVMTGSLAERIDKRPIENLGVRPDIQYDLSVVDLQEDYQEYVAAILETLQSLVQSR